MFLSFVTREGTLMLGIMADTKNQASSARFCFDRIFSFFYFLKLRPHFISGFYRNFILLG